MVIVLLSSHIEYECYVFKLMKYNNESANKKIILLADSCVKIVNVLADVT